MKNSRTFLALASIALSLTLLQGCATKIRPTGAD